MSAVNAMIHCPGCGKNSPWKPQYAGRKLRCKCGHIIEVSVVPPAHDDDGPEILEDPAAHGVPVADLGNPLDGGLPLAAEAPAPADPPPDDKVADPDDFGAYGLAPMPAIPIKPKPRPVAAREADVDDDDLLPSTPARGGAVATAIPRGPVLGYNSARRRASEEELEQVASYQRKEMLVPAILIAVGLLATFVQARVDLGEFDILMMAVYVAVATVINLVLISIALLVAAKMLDLGLGEIAPALLKIAAVAILPSAIGGIIQASLGFFGGMLAWAVSLALYFVLLMWLFEMDTQEMMIATVLIWFMRTWVAYFIIMAIFGLGGDKDTSANTGGGNAGGTNSGWVAPADDGDPDDPPDDGTDPATQPATPNE